MKYATFDAQTNILNARYDTTFHTLQQIPAGAKELTEEEFARTLNEQDGIWAWTANGLEKQPLPSITVAELWAAIKSKRDNLKAGGVKVSDQWFHSDDSSRIQQIGLVMMGAGIPAGLQWKTMDGSFVLMTQALAAQIFSAVAASDQTIFAVAEAHKAAMEASADPAAYDYSTGWPATYEG